MAATQIIFYFFAKYISSFLLVARAALLAFSSSKRLIHNLNQEANSGGIDFVKVHGYFVRISFALPAVGAMDVRARQA
jgi:hypothetical protein